MTEFDHSDILYVKDLDARIAYLQNVHPDERDEFEEEELEDLIKFRHDIHRTWGESSPAMSLVSEVYWPQYAESKATDIYGAAAETLYWDDERWSSDLLADFEPVRWNHITYWGDGS